MKAISSLYNIDWSRFEDLPDEAPSGVDVAALQQRLNKGHNTPLRWKSGCFRCPVDATDGQRWQIMEQAVKVFITLMAKEGWELRSKVTILDSAYPALELSDKTQETKPMEGFREYVVKAVFEKLDFKPMRIELPPHLIRPN